MLDEAGLISTQQGRGTYIWENPSEETNHRLRQQGLQELTQRYLESAQRLGYNPDEVAQALKAQWNAWRQAQEDRKDQEKS